MCDMNAITTLTAEEARHLVDNHQEECLCLNALEELQPRVAEELARFSGTLHLNGLGQLSLADAECLAEHEGELALDGLGELSEELACALMNCALETDQERRAQHDVEIQETIDWINDGAPIEALDSPPPHGQQPDPEPEVRPHKGGLSLNGLGELSERAAEALATCEGPLELNGLRSLPPDVARSLAANGHGVSLNGLADLDGEAAEHLADCEGVVSLNGLTELSDEAAASFASEDCRCESVTLESLATLSASAVVAFASREGMRNRVSLGGVIGLAADALNEYFDRCYGDDPPDEDDDLWLTVNVTRFELTQAQAKMLSGIRQEVQDRLNDGLWFFKLWLRDLRSNRPDEVIEELTHHRGPLELGLEELTDQQTEILAQRIEGRLCLNQLRAISDWQAGVFSRYQGRIELNGVAHLEYHAARLLAERKGTLTLYGLRNPSAEVDAVLRLNPDIRLPEFEEDDEEYRPPEDVEWWAS